MEDAEKPTARKIDTLFYNVAHNDHAAITEFLTENPGMVNASNGGAYLLHVAALHESVETVKLLLDAKANINARTYNGSTPLFNAVWGAGEKTDAYRSQEIDPIVELLIESRADVNVGQRVGTEGLHASDSDGETPLHAAVSEPSRGNNVSTRMSIVNMLLDAGANVNSINRSGVEALLTRGADVNIQGGTTPLHAALVSPYVSAECVEALLTRGADVNIQDQRGNTPLHCVARYSWWPTTVRCARLLLEHNATPNVQNKRNETPLHLAVAGSGESSSYTLRCMSLLLNNDAEVDARTKKGKTPLHIAADHLCASGVQLLLDNKADINAETFGDEPKRPLSFALAQSHFDMANRPLQYWERESISVNLFDTAVIFLVRGATCTDANEIGAIAGFLNDVRGKVDALKPREDCLSIRALMEMASFLSRDNVFRVLMQSSNQSKLDQLRLEDKLAVCRQMPRFSWPYNFGKHFSRAITRLDSAYLFSPTTFSSLVTLLLVCRRLRTLTADGRETEVPAIPPEIVTGVIIKFMDWDIRARAVDAVADTVRAAYAEMGLLDAYPLQIAVDDVPQLFDRTRQVSIEDYKTTLLQYMKVTDNTYAASNKAALEKIKGDGADVPVMLFGRLEVAAGDRPVPVPRDGKTFAEFLHLRLYPAYRGFVFETMAYELLRATCCVAFRLHDSAEHQKFKFDSPILDAVISIPFTVEQGAPVLTAVPKSELSRIKDLAVGWVGLFIARFNLKDEVVDKLYTALYQIDKE